MCTLTIIPTPAGFRLATSRDEQRSRPAATPPVSRVIAGRPVLAPTDALAGGTWVGVSDTGLVMSLLNANPTPAPAMPPAASLRSRGLIIPHLFAAVTARAAGALLQRMDLGVYAPFRLVAADDAGVIDARWDRASLVITDGGSGPACFVSSGLGDDAVAPRLDLFESFLREFGATPAMQDRFHRHAWSDRPEISVAMSRHDARTVSVTVVEVPGVTSPAVMTYRDDSGVVRAELPRVDARRAATRAPAASRAGGA